MPAIVDTMFNCSIFIVFNIFSSFYHTAIHGCAVIVFILAGRAGRQMGGRAVAATLSGLDVCDHKLEEVQTWYTCSYHGLIVQPHGQTRV